MSQAVHHPFHAVQFYSEERSLFETAGSFLAQGVVEGHAAIIVATGRHTAGILDNLRGRMVDITRAQRMGRLVVFDADRLIEIIFSSDIPDVAKFDEQFGPLMDSMTRAGGPNAKVHLYGEAVDVLWRQGRYDAAIRLELIGNDFLKRYPVAIQCGYAMRNFLNETMLFDEVCRQHSHVMPARTAH